MRLCLASFPGSPPPCTTPSSVVFSRAPDVLYSVGDLLTVAPWAARTMPGLFALNERAVLLGHWEHGFFSFAAVGAYNVGSIRLEVDKVDI